MQDALKTLKNLRDDLSSKYGTFEDKLEMIRDFLNVDLESIIDDISDGIDQIEELESDLSEAKEQIEKMESELDAAV